MSMSNILDMGVVVVYTERNTWSGLVLTVIAVTVYVVLVLQQAAGGPLTEVNWLPLMLWTIGGGIAATIVLSIVWGIIAGVGEPAGVGRVDQRDRDIERIGSRVGQSFLAIAGLGVIFLCAIESHWFWIANAMFFGFALSAFVGGIAQVILYRRGMP